MNKLLLPRMRGLVAGGTASWFVTKLILFNEYVDKVGGFENVDWGAVISAAGLIALDGLIAIGALKTPLADPVSPTQPHAPPRQPDLRPSDKPDATSGVMVDGVMLSAVLLRRDSGYKFSSRSLSNRAELSVKMQQVATRGLKYSRHDWIMVEASRTIAEQALHVESGASRTMKSRHCEDPAQAFDFYVLDENGNLLDGTKPEHQRYYREVAEDLRDAATDEGVSITSGVLDWGWDFYHIERARSELAFRWPADFDPDIVLAAA